MPFAKYLKRDTAMRALLRSEKMFLIPVDAYAGGKAEDWQGQNGEYLHEIDEETTLAFLERRWNNTFFPNPEDQVFRLPHRSVRSICTRSRQIMRKAKTI